MNELDPSPSAADALARLVADGHALLAPAALGEATGTTLAELAALAPSWDALPADAYLRDGGRYRQRRHDSYVIDAPWQALQPQPQRAHWQPLEYNALHGGLERWFEPVEPAVSQCAPWRHLVAGLGKCLADAARASGRNAVRRWHVEAHQFRIHTAHGIGRPTPEGAHRDGVDYVAVVLVQRRSIKGGETRVFEAAGPRGLRFTMTEPWTVLLLDDARIVHETTPIQPTGAQTGVRDTLVLTYRESGFQGPAGR